MIDEVYSRRVLELAADIPCLGRLPRPDASAKARSRPCGSTITVDLNLDADMVGDFAHEAKACTLGRASSAIMVRHAVGSSLAELRAQRDEVVDALGKLHAC